MKNILKVQRKSVDSILSVFSKCVTELNELENDCAERSAMEAEKIAKAQGERDRLDAEAARARVAAKKIEALVGPSFR